MPDTVDSLTLIRRILRRRAGRPLQSEYWPFRQRPFFVPFRATYLSGPRSGCAVPFRLKNAVRSFRSVPIFVPALENTQLFTNETQNSAVLCSKNYISCSLSDDRHYFISSYGIKAAFPFFVPAKSASFHSVRSVTFNALLAIQR